MLKLMKCWKNMYTQDDFKRLIPETNSASEYRSEFWRDYARVLHSPSFRRLVGKTQLFPGNESDFFRNRLTHSLEVAQIAKTIARKCNSEIRIIKNSKYNELDLIDTDLIEIACHIHDIGHPPFGHQGEEELDRIMLEHGGFEGNAQSLRLITKLEKKIYGIDTKDEKSIITNYGFNNGKDLRFGLNLTYRSIASFLKYDIVIPAKIVERIPKLLKEMSKEIDYVLTINKNSKSQLKKLNAKKREIESNEKDNRKRENELYRIGNQIASIEEIIQTNIKEITQKRLNKAELLKIKNKQKYRINTAKLNYVHPIKGYYREEKHIVDNLKNNYNFKGGEFKTIECRIMDLSDDIAYAIYDFEDSLKGDFIQPLDLVTINSEVLRNISDSITKKFPERRLPPDQIQLRLYNLFSKILSIKDHMNFTDPDDITRVLQELIANVYRTSERISSHGHLRTKISSLLVNFFVREIKFEYNAKTPMHSKIKLKEETLILLEILKKVTFELQVHSTKLRIVESRGKEIVRTIFEAIEKSNGEFLPRDFRTIYNSYPKGSKGEQQRKRTICDFVAGMTDKYAVEFYGRLKSEEPQTIFKRV